MSFWRRIFQFQHEKIAPWIAFRNTLGLALALAAGIAFGQIPAALVVAIGALNVSYSDSHDPYLLRARRMLAASGVVAIAVFVGAVCGNRHVLAVPVTGAWAFAAGMLVALSPAAADLGSISLVTLVVFAAKPLPIESAASSGLLALGGGLLETALSLVFWPVRRNMPERRALATLYTELARIAVEAPDVHAAPPASAQSTLAQSALESMTRDYSIEGERYRMLLSQAERTRLGLFALNRLRTRMAREAGGEVASVLLGDYLEMAAGALRSIAEALLAANPVMRDLSRLQAFAEQLRDADAALPEAVRQVLPDARSQIDAINGQLRAAQELATSATPSGLAEFARQEVRKPWRLRLAGTLATLRANLSLRSAACRHAIRLAVCVAIGDAVGRALGFTRSYWLPMTVAIVLRPDFGSTFTRGVLRLGGTFAGLIFSTFLFHLLPGTPAAHAAAIVALMFVLRCWGPANYGVLVIAVTGLVVLLIAMVGTPPKEVIAARGLNTAIGGLIALAAYWLWPTWERTRIQNAMAQMLAAYREYFHAIRESYLHPDKLFAAQLDRTRVAARRARSNLEASFERLRAEPGTNPAMLTALSGMLASSHRLIHAIMALEAGIAASPAVPARPAFRPFADDLEATLESLAGTLRGAPPRQEKLPNLREDHNALTHSGDPATARYALVNVETDRMTNSLNTFSEQLPRLLETSKPGYLG